MILHVGAPKCGSSALQTVLSHSPDLKGGDGTKYRYTSALNLSEGISVRAGSGVSKSARLSPYGYATWPNFGPKSHSPSIFRAMQATLKKGLRCGFVPILSCEGWIGHHSLFAQALADWGHPPVDVVVFLRPVADWTNAAYWQWGIWSAQDIDRWLARNNMNYAFGQDVATWAKIPNVRVIVRSMRPDVIAAFSDLYDLRLKDDQRHNTASPAALIGFLMRNRHFRPTGHEASTEFVVQRWCSFGADEAKLWALGPRQIRSLRPVASETLKQLQTVMTPEDFETLLADPRWESETPYHSDIIAGLTRLDDPEGAAALYGGLCKGLKKAIEAAGLSLPDCPSPPKSPVYAHDWDTAIATVLEMLLWADEYERHNTVPFWHRKLASYLGLRQHA